MASPTKKSTTLALEQQIKHIEKDIKSLKAQLLKPHLLAKSPEQDLEIKSKIIYKQNEMIELLIRQSKKNSKG